MKLSEVKTKLAERFGVEEGPADIKINVNYVGSTETKISFVINGNTIFSGYYREYPNCCGITIAYGFTFSSGSSQDDINFIVKLITKCIMRRSGKSLIQYVTNNSQRRHIEAFKNNSWERYELGINRLHGTLLILWNYAQDGYRVR